MAGSIDIDGLTASITTALSEYSNEIADAVDKLVTKKGKKLKDNIAADSPTKTGAYKRGWKVKTTSTERGNKSVIVYNEEKGYLTHLLENGHAKKNGGRVQAFPHIKNNEVKIIEEFQSELEAIIENGG